MEISLPVTTEGMLNTLNFFSTVKIWFTMVMGTEIQDGDHM